MSEIENFQVLLAISREGSLAAAARVLNVNYSTVRRKLAQAETRMGVKLFERGSNGQRITPAGREYLAAAAQADAVLADAERRVIRRDPRLQGTLRVTTTQSFFDEYLVTHLPAFTARHPKIQLAFAFGNAFQDLSRREADVALRFSNDPGNALVGMRACAVSFAHYARREPVGDARWIGWREGDSGQEWHRDSPAPEAAIWHTAASEGGQVALARAGLGRVWMACYLGDKDAVLHRLSGSKPAHRLDLWVLTHPDLRDTPRVRAFMDFIVPRLQADAPLFAGKRG